jgi:ATP-dependent RNA helicase RhlB
VTDVRRHLPPIELVTTTPFRAFHLPESVRRGVERAGFQFTTPIQQKILPLALAGRDVAGQAQTGTGKTAAFLITIFTHLLERAPKTPPRGPRALIVAPTRELVLQIREDAARLGHYVPLAYQAVFGGIEYRKQRDALAKRPDVLIGTPGRLLDYEQQRATTFASVEILVVDEADRMFDMGFIRDLRKIFRRCPPPSRRQTMLFSATLSLRVMELAYEHTNDAVKVEIEPERVTARGIHEQLFHVPTADKLGLLLGLLAREGGRRVLIFVNRKDTAGSLVAALRANGYACDALAGNVRQEKRIRILRDFKEGHLPVLVATDVASRGLHIEGVTHVVNYDLPQDAEDYVHRVGRTARAGAEGDAISLADEDYVFSLDAIEKLIGRKIPESAVPRGILVEARGGAAARRSHGRSAPRRGDRSSPHGSKGPPPSSSPAARVVFSPLDLPADLPDEKFGRPKKKIKRR